ARLDATLTGLKQSTFLGTTGEDIAFGLAVHPVSGDVYVAVMAGGAGFPGTAGGAREAYGGGSSDAAVARLDASLTSLTQATHLGGSSDDIPMALAIHPPSGGVYIVGITFSTDFPGTANGIQPALSGDSAAFVARLDATLTGLTQATYLGTGGFVQWSGLAIHPVSGHVYPAGTSD